MPEQDFRSGNSFKVNNLQLVLAMKQLGLNDNKPLVVIS